MNRFRPTQLMPKLSVTLGFVLSLVCFFGAQASDRAGPQPLSVADQLWHSVAANNSHFGQRLKGVVGQDSDGLFDGAPDITGLINEWPTLCFSTTIVRFSATVSASYHRNSLQQPQSRAPPLV